MFGNEKVDKSEVAYEDNLQSVKGLKVWYADDGYMLRVEYPQGVENPLLKETVQENNDNKISTKGAELPSGIILLHGWGANNNKLYLNRSDNKLYGSGRMTVYSGNIGQGNHRLTKGDVATKLSCDNCKLGTRVYVTAKAKNGKMKTVAMRKYDAGGMPDAIVDVWETGQEFWGYNWKDSHSITGTTIEHANLDIEGKQYYR